MHEQTERTLIAVNWNSLCQSAASNAAIAAQTCLPEFKQLIEQEVPRLTGLPEPQNQAEAAVRRRLTAALSSKVSSIANASLSAKSHPQISSDIFQLTRQFSEQVPLDGDVLTRSTMLSTAISSLCNSTMG